MSLATKSEQRVWMRVAIKEIERQAKAAGAESADFIVNCVLEVAEDGSCEHFEHP